MLTGRVPYDGESDVAMIYSVINTDPAPLPVAGDKKSRLCQDIIHHCLVRNPKDRYPSAHVLAEDIENATEGSKSSYHSRPSKSSIFFQSRGRRWPSLTAAALAILLLAALVIPQSRGFLRSVTGFGGYDKLGVAVTPFVFAGELPRDSAFGRGLSASVLERLVNLEPYTDKFWVVPLEEILRRKVADEKIARTVEGAERAVTGSGVVLGDTISLTLTVHDTTNGKQVIREFRDLGGNLKTWQDELPAWLARVIDPDLELPPGVTPRPRGTNIPSAFLHFQSGVGYLNNAPDGRPAPLTAEAIPQLERAVAADSSFTCAWTQLGRAVWLRDRNDETKGAKEAEKYLSIAVRLDSTSVWANTYLGDLKVWLGENEAARDHFQKALFQDPKHVPTLNKLAGLYMSEGRMEDAEALYRLSIQARPRYPRAYRDLGLLRYYDSDYEGAREDWKEWGELAPDDFAVYSLLGVASFELGDYAHAEEMFLRSLEIEPSFAVYENMATLYYYDQRYVDSIAMTQEALARSPDEFTTWRTYARACRFAPGYEDSAEAAFEKALELVIIERQRYPRDPDLMAAHASFYAILGPREQSLALLEKLETDYPELEVSIMFSIASTYEELGERERALDWLETAVEKELSFRKMDNYPVLKNLQTHPRYIALRNKYEE
jgi:tetratricopeptide (TPR) repeat protein